MCEHHIDMNGKPSLGLARELETGTPDTTQLVRSRVQVLSVGYKTPISPGAKALPRQVKGGANDILPTYTKHADAVVGLSRRYMRIV
jgi:hypothetical protein